MEEFTNFENFDLLIFKSALKNRQNRGRQKNADLNVT